MLSVVCCVVLCRCVLLCVVECVVFVLLLWCVVVWVVEVGRSN